MEKRKTIMDQFQENPVAVITAITGLLTVAIKAADVVSSMRSREAYARGEARRRKAQKSKKNRR